MYLPGPAIRNDYTPKGLVEEVQYPGSVPGPSFRRMIVYLPPDYYRTGRHYPVLYLLHGARGYETSWYLPHSSGEYQLSWGAFVPLERYQPLPLATGPEIHI